jgi:transcriptional regulator with XRE-family HTH domain
VQHVILLGIHCRSDLDEGATVRDTMTAPSRNEPAVGGRELGARIRGVRGRRGLTVVDLANKAQVSKSLISQIERGLAAPSIETLRRVAAALEVPLFSLFLDGAGGEMVVRANQRQTVMYPDTNVTREILSFRPHGRMAVLWATFPPGEQSGPQPGHHHPGEECIVVIRGTLDVLMDEQTVVLHAGDSMTFDSSLPHVFHNRTNESTEILVAISPPTI